MPGPVRGPGDGSVSAGATTTIQPSLVATSTSRSPTRCTTARSRALITGVGIIESAGGRGQRDLVRAGHVQPEGLGPFDEPAHIGVAAQQVLDELPAQGLLPSHHLPAGLGVALGQAGDRGVDHVQHGVGGGPHGVAVPRADHHRQLAPTAAGPRER